MTFRTATGIAETLPIVGVMGSGVEASKDRAEILGQWLAGEEVHLLTGGGGGLMEAISRAFHETPGRSGKVLGILPGIEAPRLSDPTLYPNPWVEIPIYTHLPLSGVEGTETGSRNHINVLTSDVIVALAGGAGTASEVTLAVKYERPVIAFLDSPGDIPNLPENVRIESRFEAIQAFVRGALRGRSE